MRNLIIAVAILAVSAGAAVAEQAGSTPVKGSPTHPVAVDVYAGGFSAAQHFSDGSRFGSSDALGAAATFWVGHYLGLRGDLTYAHPSFTPSADPISHLAGQKSNVYAYDADVVLRYPLPGLEPTQMWYPYALGGVGAQQYRFHRAGGRSDFMDDVGVGLSYQFGHGIGAHVEARDLRSNFTYYELDHPQSDIVYDGGISVSF